MYRMIIIIWMWLSIIGNLTWPAWGCVGNIDAGVCPLDGCGFGTENVYTNTGPQKVSTQDWLLIDDLQTDGALQ